MSDNAPLRELETQTRMMASQRAKWTAGGVAGVVLVAGFLVFLAAPSGFRLGLALVLAVAAGVLCYWWKMRRLTR
jgi:hypothetical protein